MLAFLGNRKGKLFVFSFFKIGNIEFVLSFLQNLFWWNKITKFQKFMSVFWHFSKIFYLLDPDTHPHADPDPGRLPECGSALILIHITSIALSHTTESGSPSLVCIIPRSQTLPVAVQCASYHGVRLPLVCVHHTTESDSSTPLICEYDFKVLRF